MPTKDPSHYGFEFECALTEYTKVGSALTPQRRIGSGSIPIHPGFFAGPNKDKEGAIQIAVSAATNLISSAFVELATPGAVFPENPAANTEVTASQVHDLANALEQGKIEAKAYSLKQPKLNRQILQFVITTEDVK